MSRRPAGWRVLRPEDGPPTDVARYEAAVAEATAAMAPRRGERWTTRPVEPTPEERVALQTAIVGVFRPDLVAEARRQGRCVHCGAIVTRAMARETTIPTCGPCAAAIGAGRLP
jgi:hypothetical protein